MGRPYDHQYEDAGNSRAGEMICGECRKPITEGEYRSYKREKNWDWRYVTHHRACCANDPAWAKRDAAAATHKARWAKLNEELSAIVRRYPEFCIADVAEDIARRVLAEAA